MKTLSIKVRKNRQRKCATCFATLVQNKSNSDVSRVPTHESNLKCCCWSGIVVAKKLESSSTFHKLFIIPLIWPCGFIAARMAQLVGARPSVREIPSLIPGDMLDEKMDLHQICSV